MQEIIASFIETGDYEGEGTGMVGAIRYLTKKELAELRTSSDKEKLSMEVMNAAAAERALLRALSDDLASGFAKVNLSKSKKASLKPFLIEIEILYSLRNRGYPEELAKLKMLKGKTDFPDHSLIFTFRKIGQDAKGKDKYVIKTIKFVKTEDNKPSKSDPDSFIGPDGTFA